MSEFISSLTSLGQLAKGIMDSEFAVVMALTFLICEGLFLILDGHAKFKQLTSILVGSLLGYLSITTCPVPTYIAGALAGGLTTLFVAKFKNNN